LPTAATVSSATAFRGHPCERRHEAGVEVHLVLELGARESGTDAEDVHAVPSSSTAIASENAITNDFVAA
jgi:hypothetical protein